MTTMRLAHAVALTILLQCVTAGAQRAAGPPLFSRDSMSREEILELGSNLKQKGDEEWQNKKYQRALDYYDEASQEIKAHKDSTTDAELLKLLASIYYQYAVVFQATGELEDAIEACEFAIGTCLRTMACPDYLQPFELMAQLNELNLETVHMAIRDYQYIAAHQLKQPSDRLKVNDKIKQLKEILQQWESLKRYTGSHYETLKIPCHKASDLDIKTAYRNLAKLYHPDKNVLADAPTRQLNEIRFKQINEAFNVLSDKNSRANYDRSTLGSPEKCFRQTV